MQSGHQQKTALYGAGELALRMFLEDPETPFTENNLLLINRSGDFQSSHPLWGHSRLHHSIQNCRWESAKNLNEDYSILVFTVPHRDSTEYLASAQLALSRWKGNRALLVSSSSVYQENQGNKVIESSLLSNSERAKTQIEVERLFLERGGNVLRSAGLYSEKRGLHRHYLNKHSDDSTDIGGDKWINLIHYSDAARAGRFLLDSPRQSALFHLSDGVPVKKSQIFTDLGHVLAAKEMQISTMPIQGKKIDSKSFIEAFNFKATYGSYREWLTQHSRKQGEK